MSARTCSSPEGQRIWALVEKLDLSAPDRDSFRLGALARLSIQADDLHARAEKAGQLSSMSYQTQQRQLYENARRLAENSDRDTD